MSNLRMALLLSEEFRKKWFEERGVIVCESNKIDTSEKEDKS